MSLAIDGESFDIDYTSSTTLTDLKESINSAAGAKVTASILQTGTNEYHLVLTSKETGTNQAITLSDSVGGTLKNELKRMMYQPIRQEFKVSRLPVMLLLNTMESALREHRIRLMI